MNNQIYVQFELNLYGIEIRMLTSQCQDKSV